MSNTQRVAHQLAKVLLDDPRLLAHPDLENAPASFRHLVAGLAGRERNYTPSDWTWKLAVNHARKRA